MKTFLCELEELINRHSSENGSNTPDFILARFMQDCLESFNRASNDRENWYKKRLGINNQPPQNYLEEEVEQPGRRSPGSIKPPFVKIKEVLQKVRGKP